MAEHVICHKACHDGMAGAWVAKKFIPYVTIHFTTYEHEWRNLVGEDGPVIEDDLLYFIDFCPLPEHLEMLTEKKIHFQVLDHHATAVNKIKDYENGKFMEFCQFDMDKSGSMLAWEWFTDEAPPLFLEYIQIGDLWDWRHDDDKKVLHYIRAIMPPSGDTDIFERTMKDFDEKEALKVGGILFAQLENSVKFATRRACILTFNGEEILAVNTRTDHSEIGHALEEKSPNGLGMTYTIYPEDNKVKFSVRGEGANIFAQKYGGGGHPKAAGFFMKLDDFHTVLKTAKEA